MGSDLTLKPIILMAHLDVVPVIEKNRANWKHDPFGGEIINDTIWGRGVIDHKVGVIGIMESLELLLKDCAKINSRYSKRRCSYRDCRKRLCFFRIISKHRRWSFINARERNGNRCTL